MRHDLDPERSHITIHASSTLHPIATGAPVSGWLDVALGADGQLDLDGPVDGLIEVDLRGMRSGNPLVDREAERRLQVRRHPTVTGRLTGLSPVTGGDGYRGVGELDVHGVTGPLAGVLHLAATDGGALRISGTTEFDVTEFGIQPPSLLLVKVHPQVRVELTAVTRRAAV